MERSYALCPHAYLQLMCDKNDRLPVQLLLNALFENVFSNMRVDGRKWIIQEENVPVGVDSSSHADPLLLPS